MTVLYGAKDRIGSRQFVLVVLKAPDFSAWLQAHTKSQLTVQVSRTSCSGGGGGGGNGEKWRIMAKNGE